MITGMCALLKDPHQHAAMLAPIAIVSLLAIFVAPTPTLFNPDSDATRAAPLALDGCDPASLEPPPAAAVVVACDDPLRGTHCKSFRQLSSKTAVALDHFRSVPRYAVAPSALSDWSAAQQQRAAWVLRGGRATDASCDGLWSAAAAARCWLASGAGADAVADFGGTCRDDGSGWTAAPLRSARCASDAMCVGPCVNGACA
jgi:hypothetical protein